MELHHFKFNASSLLQKAASQSFLQFNLRKCAEVPEEKKAEKPQQKAEKGEEGDRLKVEHKQEEEKAGEEGEVSKEGKESDSAVQ